MKAVEFADIASGSSSQFVESPAILESLPGLGFFGSLRGLLFPGCHTVT